jgi:hypothetical protein
MSSLSKEYSSGKFCFSFVMCRSSVSWCPESVLVNRAARWVEVERNEMEIRLCEKKREGRDLPTFLSPPLIKFMYFNWSKLNFAISFYFLSFYLFLFIFIYFFFDLFLFILFICFSFYLCGSFGLLLFC